jgi:GWxTD domain-containing protein
MGITNWWPGDSRIRGIWAVVSVLALAVASFLASGGMLEARQEEEGLPFFVDTATFESLENPENSYVEIYFLLSSKNLHFESGPDGFVANLLFDAVISGKDSSERWSRQWHKKIQLNSEKQLQQGYSVFDIVGLMLEPNFYDIHISLTDEGGKKVSSVSGELYVPAFSPDEFSLSQLELAVDITPAEQVGDFVKNGVRVLPNPMRTYGIDMPVLYYYAEIYGLKTGPGFDSTYSVQQEIINSAGDLLKSYPQTTKRKPGESAVEVSGINVVGLPAGTYFLRLKVRDNHTGQEVSNQRWFQVSAPTEGQLGSEEQLSLTEEEAAYRENLIRYVASDQDLKVYRSLNLAGKARFLKEFWRQRDPDPSTSVNEFRQEHMRRWNYANQHFSRFQQSDGWKTDQGRVYIIYGAPDDIERYPSGITTVAWQRWHYYSLEGGIEFIFADLSGFDNYVLIHSTAKGEYRDPNWSDKIARSPMSP